MKEVKHITRTIGEETSFVMSETTASALISRYLDDGWTLHSTHVLGIDPPYVPVYRRWWEFWKIGQTMASELWGINMLWVLTR